MIKTLDAASYDTDKAKMPPYLRNYEQWFEPLWDQSVTLLELGVHRGGSVLLWRDYFTKGTIIGLDVNLVKLEDPTGRVRLYQGLQQDTRLLDRIAAESASGGFDIIIDDASHQGEFTRISFWHLFDHHLKPGGLYVIEDWGTGYWPSWPDGSAYHFPEQAAQGRKPGGFWSRIFGGGGACCEKDPKFFHNHSSGMVGFVKQLVDECGMGDITFPGLGIGTPRQSRIHKMQISYGQVMVQKRS